MTISRLASDALFRTLIENSTDGLVLLTATGSVLYLSPTFEKILGWPIEDRLGKEPWDLLHSDDRLDAQADFARLRAHPGTSVTREVRMACTDGSWRWIQAVGTNLLEEPTVNAVVVTYRDVTQGREEENRLRTITTAIEQTDDLIFITDQNGSIRYVNAAFERITGYQRDDIVGKNPRLLKSGMHAPSFYESLWRRILAGGTFHGIFQNRKKNGEIYHDDRTITPVKNASGEVVAFVSTGRDVSTQMAMRKELNQQSRIVLSLFRYSMSPMVLMDAQFNFIRVNDAYARACQRQVEDFPGRNLFELFPSDAKPDFERVVATKRPVQFVRRPFVFPDHPEWGITYWDWTLTPVLDDRGAVELLLLSLNDVTQQLRAEEELRKREQHLRTLMDVIGDAAFTVSFPDRTIRYVNHEATKCFGYTADEMLGQTTRLFYTDDASYEEFGRTLRRAREQGKNDVQAELRLTRKDGNIFWADTRITFLPSDDGGQQVISILRDTTERKLIHEELSGSRRQLRLLYTNLQHAREEERRRIAREIHDVIGQSLTGLKMELAMIADDIYSATDHERARDILGRMTPMNALIDDTLKTAQILSAELRPAILDSQGLSAAIEWQLSEYGTKTGLRTSYKPCNECALLDHDQSIALFRILQESLVNVIRHSRAKRVTVKLDCGSTHVVLEVIDDGIGIRKTDSLGPHSLGLLGIRERALALGGEVDFAGFPQKGTRVKVTIPISRPESKRRESGSL